jgi:hypothetical protein
MRSNVERDEMEYTSRNPSPSLHSVMHHCSRVPNPLVTQRRVLFLASRVQDFEDARLVVNHHLLAVRIFNRRIVRLHSIKDKH